MAVDRQTLAGPHHVPVKRVHAVTHTSLSVATATITDMAAVPAVPAETVEQVLTRRQFLNLAWLASLGIFVAQMGAVAYHFTFPRFKAGEFGGTFSVSAKDLPELTANPLANDKGKFWVVNTDQGVLALYKVCTHLGCIYDWKPTENRFICPCHGSTFEKNGVWVRGPAPRNLDRFIVTVQDASGKPLAQTDPTKGGAVRVLDGAAMMAIDTGKLIRGERHA